VESKLYYKVEINDDPANSTNFKDLSLITRNRLLVSGLVSGKEYGFRIATITTDGMGSWSDIIVQKAL
jgi:hypothetical protein